MRRWLLATSALVASSCSLMGLEHYELAVCRAQSDCEQLNTARGIALDACERFQCVPDAEQNGEHTCRLRPRDGDGDGDPAIVCGGTDCDDGNTARSSRMLDPSTGALVPRTEICDGVDNNCDSVVDEGALFTGPASLLSASLADASHVRAAPSLSGRAGLMVPPVAAGETTRWVQPTQSGGDVALRFRTQASMSAPFTSATRTADDLSKCFQPSGNGVAVVDCFPGEAAAAEIDASASGTMVLAALDRSACAGGLLRVGLFTRDTRGPVDAFGPGRRSPLANGIGSTTWPVLLPDGTMDPSTPASAVFGTCTGDASHRTPAGASRPAVVALGDATVPHAGSAPALPQALAAWLGRPPATDACSAPTAPVEAQAVWVESNVPPGWSWLNGSDSGQSISLGTGRGDAPPAIVATQYPPGYLVAFPAATGGIALRFIAAVDTSVVSPLDNITADLAAYDAAPEIARQTPSLVVRDLGTVLTSLGAIESVAMAPRSHGPSGSSLDVGVVVQTGCGQSVVRRASFARLSVDLAGVAHEGAAVVDLGGAASTLPQIAYLPDGMLAQGGQWHGQTVTADTTGGWWTGWIDGGGAATVFTVLRIAELDGAALDAAAVPIPVNTAGDAREGLLIPAAIGAAGSAGLSVLSFDARGGWSAGAACRGM